MSRITPLLYWVSLALMGSLVPSVQSVDFVVSVDRTTWDWSDLAMGPPSADDDADQSQNPQVAFTYSTNAGAISASTSAPMGNKFYRLRKL